MSIDLSGKVMIITGASSGIGAATAKRAAERGMKLVLAARRVEKLQSVAETVRSAGGEAIVTPTDVADRAAVDAMVARALEAFGRVDVMFANAGFGYFADTSSDDPSGTEQTMWDVNYHGTMHCVRAVVGHMKQRGSGHLVLTSSVAAKIGLPYYGAYAATKAAQMAAVYSMGPELAPFGVHVSGVYPTGTTTEFADVAAQSAPSEVLFTNTPKAFLQSPEHVAKAVIKCLRRPRPEVWPSFAAYLGAVLWTAFPSMQRWAMRGHAKRCRAVLEGDEKETADEHG